MQTLRTSWETTALVEEYTNILTAMEILVSGFLPSYFIEHNTFAYVLHTIKADLLQSGTKLQLIHDKPAFYYSGGTFTYTVHNNMLFIQVQLPLTAFRESFHIYEIQTYPLPLQNGQKHMMILDKMPKAWALSEAQTYHYELSQQQFADLDIHHYSKIQKIFSYTQTSNCLMALWSDNRDIVDKLCQYTVTPQGLKSGIYHLAQSTYVMIDVKEYTLSCINDTITHFTGCDSCTISLPKECSFSDGKRYIPRSLTETKHARRTGLQHITNLGLLLKFFDNSSLERIRGDTLLPSPPKLSMPDFKFYKHELENTFAKQDADQLSLERVSDAARNDRVIISSLTEARAVYGDTRGWWNYWTSPDGIILACTALITILLVINACYINFQVRKMTVTLLILKQHITNVQSQFIPTELDYFKQQAAKEALKLNATSAVRDHMIFIQATVTLWPQIIATALACILLIIALYKCYRRRNPDYLKQCTTRILLEFDSRTQTILVPLQEILGHPQDFQVQSLHYISDIQVTGDLRTYLMFNWPTFELHNIMTGATHTLKTRYPITWWTAYHLRKILKGAYVCLPVYVSGNRLQRIYIQRPELPATTEFDNRLLA